MKLLVVCVLAVAFFAISTHAQVPENCFVQQRSFDLCQLATRECMVERYTLYAFPVASTASQCVWQVWQAAINQCGTAVRLLPISTNITRIDEKLYGMIQINCGGRGSKNTV